MRINVNKDKVEILENENEAHEGEYLITKCYFTFDEFIDAFQVKRAIFTIMSTGEMYETDILNNECDIPAEVLKHEFEKVKLGVYAYDIGENEELVRRASPSHDKFSVPTGSYEEGAETPEPITPTQYDIYSAKLQEGLDSIDDKIDEIDSEVDTKFQEIDGKITEIDSAIEEANQAVEDAEEAVESTNNLNIDVNKVDKTTQVDLTKKDGTTKTVYINDGTSLQFMWQGTSLGIKTDTMQDYVFVDLQGTVGPQGPQGNPFQIKKTYATVQLMIADYDNMEINDYVMISGNIEEEDNAKLFVKTETEDPTYRWQYLADFSGASGIVGPTGATPNIQIGTVVSGSTPSVTRTGTNENPIFNFVLQPGPTGATGQTGATGATGNGIASIVKTASAGLIDTYTITFTDGTTSTFNITNGQDGEVTQEYVDEENERLKSLYNVLPKVSDSGESVELENTGDTMLYKMDLKGNTSQDVVQGEVGLEEEDTSIYVDDVNEDKENYITLEGNTYQETTTGKNLLLNNATTQTISGVTFTKNSDGTITANGTANANIYLNLNTEVTLNAGSYILSGCPSGGSSSTYTLYENSAGYNKFDYGSGLDITLSESKTFRVSLAIYSGANVNNLVFKPMIRLASITDDTYEPYTNGASPNPDYPQEIEVVTGLNEVKVEGKNLLSSELETGGISVETGQNSSAGRTRTKDYIDIQPNTEYTLSADYQGWYVVCYYNESQTFISSLSANSTKITFTTPSNAKYLRCVVSILNATKVQLELGNQATPYEAYQGASYPVNLGSIELCKIGTYQDRIYKSNGNWYLHKEIGKVVLDGSENVTYGTVQNSYYLVQANMNLGVLSSNLLCDKLRAAANWNVDIESIWYGGSGNTRLQIKLLSSRLTDTTTTVFKNWLSSNNLIVYYVLATPTDTQITDTTLVNQLNALYNATIYSTTHINTETSNLLPYIDLKYNVVTPAPSPDRASEVEVVTGNNTITISNEDGTKTQTYNITLNNLELCKIGDYQDYFYKDNGNWYKYKSVEKILLNGTENYDMSSNGNVFYLNNAITNITSIENMKCNYYLYDTFSNLYNGNTDYGISLNTNISKIAIRDKDISSINDFKTWLSNNNTIIYYPLTTPTTTQINDQLLVSQLDELQKAMSYYDKTLITQVNDDKPFILDVVGIRDLQDIFNIINQ